MFGFLFRLIRFFLSVFAALFILESIATHWMRDSFSTYRKASGHRIYQSQWSPIVGRFYLPHLSNVESADISNSMLISYSRFSTDEIGRRVTPQDDRARKESTVFFGCSFAFGRGLNDDETLPYYFGKLHPEQRIYNYAVPGSGPQQMLRWIDSGLLKKTMEIPPKLGVYVFVPEHFPRVSNPFIDDYDRPFYSLENGVLESRGLFRDAQPWLANLHERFHQTYTFRALLRLSPRKTSEEDKKLFCEMVSRSRDLFLETFPSSKFVVFNYSISFRDHSLDEELRRCAKEKNLELIEYEDQLPPEKAVIDFHFDQHPSPLSNEKAAAALNQAL